MSDFDKFVNLFDEGREGRTEEDICRIMSINKEQYEEYLERYVELKLSP
jgi:hypothetical protein